ncbi:hypothetical protein K493DRAFT_318137 [Basidiobolus meristosporus CBS 931.73]|uniref:3-oxo-5-alpha-steroid 4-dehydrogenase C-terminal domain-containing protein n=1 Tax=Basidiobolus meristosporus CBS 931.73 TaxID=1314790 RepID=A0A1Y1XWU3_9FUNG|nr:hypothetical protein K493DRAFT_318137 [Basidiobolus meristosporus CBS 931.73]|eukprot:ORX90208.1 hypothetical protein K493DRAFT_318137 [Basidiobolus meristosporus CBS 931.73]
MYILLTGIIIYLEGTGKFHAPYGKFRKTYFHHLAVTTRAGMFTAHFVPAVLVLLLYIKYGNWRDSYHLATFGFLFAQYVKRTLECLFLHRYAGNLCQFSMMYLILYHSIISVTCCYSVLSNPRKIGPSELLCPIPLIMYSWLGNLWHHSLLMELRPRKGKYNVLRSYRVPKRGWFRWVVCPHYCFECFAWFGFAMIARTTLVFSVVLLISASMASRSVQTRRWYSNHLEEFPVDRWCIIPFLL